MRTFHVHFYDRTKRERPVVYRVRARTLVAVLRSLQSVLDRHLADHPHQCTVTGWSVSGLSPRHTLPRILAAGGIHNGQVTGASTNVNRVGRTDHPRAS